jgi:ethanolamine ammonia-lyase small subunit
MPASAMTPARLAAAQAGPDKRIAATLDLEQDSQHPR